MSGTSMDGVTAALAKIEDIPEVQEHARPRLKVRLLTYETYPYPLAVREHLLELCEAGSTRKLCTMNFQLGEIFAAAALKIIEKAGKKPSDIGIIGSHGQTVCHLPRQGTLQIGEPAVIAERTGITTVGDFRPRDIAAGGEGAPLIPYVDYVLFSSPKISRVLLNIGGIANVTYLPAGTGLEEIKAFDTGPGNMLLDGVMQRLTKGELSYDKDGALASKGRVYSDLLAELMRHPFIRKAPPKSTGREEFGNAFLDKILDIAQQKGLSTEDLLATLTAFTVESIVENCRLFLGEFTELIASGGGAKNRALMRGLGERLVGVKVTTTQEYGIPVEAKEALGFAILAYQTLNHRPNNVPAATGAKRAVVLGKITQGR